MTGYTTAALPLVALGVSELRANSQRRAKRYVRHSRHSTQYVGTQHKLNQATGIATTPRGYRFARQMVGSGVA